MWKTASDQPLFHLFKVIQKIYIKIHEYTFKCVENKCLYFILEKEYKI